MGKQRRQRKKFHQPSKSQKTSLPNEEPMETQPILLPPAPNLFAGVDINIDNLKKTLSDTHSIKSYKSEMGKKLPKEDKIKLRRQMLLEKLDATRKAKKKKPKRKDADDASQSLQSLLQEKVDKMLAKPKPKRKGTQKASKRKRYFLRDVDLFKKLMYDKEFKTDPRQVISKHIANVIERDKRKK